MIRIEIARAATALAQELAIAGIALAVKPDSDLAALNVAGFAPIPALSQDVTPELINAQSTIPAVGYDCSEHDAVLDERTTALANIARQHINFAKNVATPAVRDMVERVTAALAAVPTTVTFNPTVVMVNLPEPMREGAMESLVASFEQPKTQLRQGRIKLSEFNEDLVRANLKVGVKLLDVAAEMWYARKGADFFRNVWNTVFSGNFQTSGATAATLVGNPIDGADAALAIFLLSKNLVGATPPEGSQGTLADIRQELTEINFMAGFAMKEAYARFALAVKNQRLIISVEGNKQTVNVWEPMVNAWYDQGGSQALLAANCLLDRPHMRAPEIDAASKQLLESWEQHNRVLTRTEASNRKKRLGDVLLTCGIAVIHDHREELFEGALAGEVISVSSASVLRAEEALKAYVAEMVGMGYVTERTVWELCTDAITKHVLADTASHEIINGISEVTSEYPEMSINDAVTLVAIDYLIDYVAGQFYVTSA